MQYRNKLSGIGDIVISSGVLFNCGPIQILLNLKAPETEQVNRAKSGVKLIHLRTV